MAVAIIAFGVHGCPSSSASSLPVSSSITKYVVPDSVVPKSVTRTQFWWSSRDALVASRSKRLPIEGSRANSGCKTLIATSRSSPTWLPLEHRAHAPGTEQHVDSIALVEHRTHERREIGV